MPFGRNSTTHAIYARDFQNVRDEVFLLNSLHWEEIDEDLSLESLFDFKRELHYAKI